MQRVKFKVCCFFLLSLSILSAAPTTTDIQIKATVLNDFIGSNRTPDETYGLDLPKVELGQIEDYLEHTIKLYPISEYVHRYQKSEDRLIGASFWMRIENQTPTQATVYTGGYPVVVHTKFGPMPCYTTDWAYYLAKQKDHWIVISKKVVGES